MGRARRISSAARSADSVHRALHLPRSAYGMTISHIGLAIVLIGITGSLAWKTEYLQVMHPGDSAAIAGYQFRFIGVDDNFKGPNYAASRATFIVTKNGRYIVGELGAGTAHLHQSAAAALDRRHPHQSSSAISMSFWAIRAASGDLSSTFTTIRWCRGCSSAPS